MQIEVKELSVHYEVFGEGEPLLFLHGWGAPFQIYRPFLNKLAAKYQVIALDFPGFGLSEEPLEAWNVNQYAEMILEFVHKIEIEPKYLICHSFGGRVSIKLLSEKKNQFHVEKLVLMDAAGVRSKKGLRQQLREKSYKLAKRIYSIEIISKMYPDLLDEMRAKRGSADYNNASPVMKATLVKAVNEDQRDELKNIEPQTLLIWGEKDTATPMEQARVMEREIKNVEMVAYPGAGHFSFIENSEDAVAKITGFLG